mgnify:FL=1
MYSKHGCILSKFYIKPQHFDFEKRINYSCILSKFYIKPQPQCGPSMAVPVVSYRNSTSNHNLRLSYSLTAELYLIEILHQTTTDVVDTNCWYLLYLIEILHQTTTMPVAFGFISKLYLIEILHQTTTIGP